MATQLIEAMTRKWEPDDYKDEFRAQLRKIIDEQVARQSGKKVRAHKTRGGGACGGDDQRRRLHGAAEAQSGKRR